MMDHKAKIKQYLAIRFSGELFAVDMANVRNIISNIAVHGPGRKAEYITGYLDIDDKIIPVIDVKAKLRIENVLCENPCIIVAEAKMENRKSLLSFAVDSIQDVLNIDVSEIQPADGRYGETGLLKGNARSGYKLLKILDINKLCPEGELEKLLKAG